MQYPWRQWLRKLTSGRPRRKAVSRRNTRLTLEALEERTLLSAATHFAIVGLPNPVPVGTAVTFTVEALDASSNVDSGYNGMVHVTSGDSHAVLPASAPLTSGVGTFSATLATVGSQSITVTGPTYDSPPLFVADPLSG